MSSELLLNTAGAFLSEVVSFLLMSEEKFLSLAAVAAAAAKELVG